MITLTENQVMCLELTYKEYNEEAINAKAHMNEVNTSDSIDAYIKAKSKLNVAYRFMFQLGLETD